MAAKKFYPSISVTSKKNCKPYFIIIIITVLIMIGIFWLVNFKTHSFFRRLPQVLYVLLRAKKVGHQRHYLDF
jgi:hypothetical protein